MKHLPVIDGSGVLVGVVSRGVLVRTFVRSDDEIRGAVLTEVFLHVLWIDAGQVDVSVTDGIVTLRGVVDQRSTAEIRERLVHRLDGVVDVVSALEHRVDDGGVGGRPPRRPQPAPSPTTDRTGITA